MTIKSMLFGPHRDAGLRTRNSLSGRYLRWYLLLVPLAIFACLALWPARAVTPAPTGGYPTQNTAGGTDALNSLTTGNDDTATGFDALWANTTGSNNTATGSRALQENTTSSNNTANGSAALQSTEPATTPPPVLLRSRAI